MVIYILQFFLWIMGPGLFKSHVTTEALPNIVLSGYKMTVFRKKQFARLSPDIHLDNVQFGQLGVDWDWTHLVQWKIEKNTTKKKCMEKNTSAVREVHTSRHNGLIIKGSLNPTLSYFRDV